MWHSSEDQLIALGCEQHKQMLKMKSSKKSKGMLQGMRELCDVLHSQLLPARSAEQVCVDL